MAKKEKSKFVQIIAYLGIAFISILLAALFVGQDAIRSCTPGTSQQNLLASINGEEIKVMEFFRYKDRFQNRYDVTNPQISNQIMNQYFNIRIINQLATKMGLDVSDQRIEKSIKKTFQNPVTKKYDANYLKGVLSKYNIPLSTYYKDFKIDILNGDYISLIYNGIELPESELKNEYDCENTQLKIKYAFISNAELKKNFKNTIKISDQEVTDYLTKNPDEVKDPKTDKDRVRRKLEQKQFDLKTKELRGKIETLSNSKKSFAEAAAILKGKIATSAVFKLGSPVKEDKKNGKSLTSLSNSKIFLEKLLSLETGKTSSAIETPTGIYIFTPTQKQLSTQKPTKDELAIIEQRLKYQIFNDIRMKLFDQITSQNKIKMYKNIKTN